MSDYISDYVNWGTAGAVLLGGFVVVLVVFSMFRSRTGDPEQKQVREPETVTVTIERKGFSFVMEPDRLAVMHGDTVQWKLKDEGSFTIVFQSYPEGGRAVLSEKGTLKSPELTEPGDQWSVKFTANVPTGTYRYVSPEHEDVGLEGVVRVTPRE